MGIQRVTTINITCDRCPAKTAVTELGTEAKVPFGWVTLNGNNYGRGGEGKSTLCPDCMKWLASNITFYKKPVSTDQKEEPAQ